MSIECSFFSLRWYMGAIYISNWACKGIFNHLEFWVVSRDLALALVFFTLFFRLMLRFRFVVLSARLIYLGYRFIVLDRRFIILGAWLVYLGLFEGLLLLNLLWVLRSLSHVFKSLFLFVQHHIVLLHNLSSDFFIIHVWGVFLFWSLWILLWNWIVARWGLQILLFFLNYLLICIIKSFHLRFLELGPSRCFLLIEIIIWVSLCFCNHL